MCRHPTELRSTPLLTLVQYRRYVRAACPTPPCPPRAHASWSAPASPGSARRSSCRRPARPTSWSIERGGDVGGTWRDNTYPGAACDVPSPALLVLVRAEPRLVARRSPRSRRSRPTSGGSPSESGVLDRFRFDTALEEPRWDDDAQRVAGRARRRGELTADVLVLRRRRRSPSPELPDIDGHRLLRRRAVPLRPLGPRRRPDRQAGRGHRHRRLGDPDRAGARRAGRATSTSTSAPRRTSSRAATGPTPALERLALRARPGRAEGLPDGDLLGAARRFVPGFTWQPRLGAAGQAGRR